MQIKWARNANGTQFCRKFRQYAAGKSHKKSTFARFWRAGMKTDRKKQQPKLLDCCLILRKMCIRDRYYDDSASRNHCVLPCCLARSVPSWKGQETLVGQERDRVFETHSRCLEAGCFLRRVTSGARAQTLLELSATDFLLLCPYSDILVLANMGDNIYRCLSLASTLQLERQGGVYLCKRWLLNR